MSDSDHPLRRYRKRKKLTLEELAERVGTTRSWLSRIESGEEQAGAALIRKLKAETGLSADCFLVEGVQ